MDTTDEHNPPPHELTPHVVQVLTSAMTEFLHWASMHDPGAYLEIRDSLPLDFFAAQN